MKSAPRRRDWIAAAAIALLISATVGAAGMGRLSGLSVDLLFWLRHHIAPVRHDPATSPAVVVAIDEETYRTPPFTELPNALWTHEIATVLNALVAADVKVVGFDVIFPTSIESLVRGFDRDFLVALHKAARDGKVVLGEVQHQEFPIHPFPSQGFAVGGSRNIRSNNLFSDNDAVIRRVPLTFEREAAGGVTRREPSMALELATRAAGTPPAKLPDGRMALGGYAIPGSERNTMMLNFEGGDAIPTYSLADLQACAAQGNTAFFRDHFAGKTVLIGAVLDVEDRKLTSMRYITGPEHPSSGARCVHPPMKDLFRADLVRDTIPGVYVLAMAVNNMLRGDALRQLSASANWAILLLLGLGGAVVTLLLRPFQAAVLLLGSAVVWVSLATLAFRNGVVLPLLAPPLAAGLSCAVLLGYRFAVTDRDRRLLRSSFGLYLAPALIDRMLESDRLPELGGESRAVTILFSDVAGFSRLSEQLAPGELVTLMNEYLTAMTDIIEAEGGFVDKYIGDAIVAVFGAPLEDPDHALHGVRAALRCRDRLQTLNRESSAFQTHPIGARIGLSTGQALVGNIGSSRRFNYTAMGDTVNLAARLEGANKIYGTAILVSAATREAAGDAIDWREIDRVRVVGRQQPETIFEPLALAGTAASAQAERAKAFSAALAEYRAGRFEPAARLFEVLAKEDAPARLFTERCRARSGRPVPEPWDAVTTLETK